MEILNISARAAVVAYGLLIAAYALPDQWVPDRCGYWSDALVPGLFHQQWTLFSPDPPDSGCQICLLDPATHVIVNMQDLHGHYLWRRMVHAICRYAEHSPRSSGDTVAVVVPMELWEVLQHLAPDGLKVNGRPLPLLKLSKDDLTWSMGIIPNGA